MHEDSIKLTAFSSPFGQFEYTRLPFCLQGAPSLFSRIMQMIFASKIKLLDFVICHNTVQPNTENVEAIVSRKEPTNVSEDERFLEVTVTIEG